MIPPAGGEPISCKTKILNQFFIHKYIFFLLSLIHCQISIFQYIQTLTSTSESDSEEYFNPNTSVVLKIGTMIQGMVWSKEIRKMRIHALKIWGNKISSWRKL